MRTLEQGKPADMQVEAEHDRKVVAAKKNELVGEKKTMEALASISADIRVVLLAELHQTVEECEKKRTEAFA